LSGWIPGSIPCEAIRALLTCSGVSVFHSRRRNGDPFPTAWWVTPLDTGPAVKTGVMKAMRQANLTSDEQEWLPYERPALDPSGDGVILAGRSGDSTNLWRVPFSRPLSAGGNKLVFSMGERTGNIWMAEWQAQH